MLADEDHGMLLKGKVLEVYSSHFFVIKFCRNVSKPLLIVYVVMT